jgi:hypothetical protein
VVEGNYLDIVTQNDVLLLELIERRVCNLTGIWFGRQSILDFRAAGQTVY